MLTFWLISSYMKYNCVQLSAIDFCIIYLLLRQFHHRKDKWLSLKHKITISKKPVISTFFIENVWSIFKEGIFLFHAVLLIPPNDIFSVLPVKIPTILHFPSCQSATLKTSSVSMVQAFSVPSGQIAFSLCLFILLYPKYLFVGLNVFTW